MRMVQLAIGGLGGPIMGPPESGSNYGEVFTRRWIVELILDLAGYTAERDLATLTAVEPACGSGAFLGPMVERLVDSARLHDRDLTGATGAIRAFDLLQPNVELARKTAAEQLIAAGLSIEGARRIAESWVGEADFLLRDPEANLADFVLGNPPYIRLEGVASARTDAYRRACPAMRGRSDIYVGFIDKGLSMLRSGGTLAFIVADRWMHNEYGADLRELVAADFSVEAVIEMHDVDAFEETVSAYPAVTIIRKSSQGRAVLSTTSRAFGEKQANVLRSWVSRGRSRSIRRSSFSAARLTSWFPGDQLWPSGDPTHLAIVADLEKRFPPLEDRRTGTRVGIGVASGADDVYLTRDATQVEEDRLLPLVMSRDTTTGRLAWSGTHLVNPWLDGELVDLAAYPRMQAYLEEHGPALRRRHVARKRPGSWFRTIDRVDPQLLSRPKLLLPDLKASSHPVLDDGRFYPHHNLYFVASDTWDLEVLGGLLLSDVANLVVGAYCVKMRGGCYRFQAQYLRRIRVPIPETVSSNEKDALARAFCERDVEAATATAIRLYGIDEFPSVT
jgi:adenine-specific DNA-methyltransferase